ncbi:ceroid-lipofuscinosis neuronal protein 6 homolog [Patella vulgata]|uniref:ceroid-lipofuscinosis neuronal protein 6 homolog n=1 Tax=Patella vulgata TaxID=6465 RepID=UPI00217F5A6D|nr:ceroid-lipofuscinosis neuronal protein 6 homolog [Patella vulgata]
MEARKRIKHKKNPEKKVENSSQSNGKGNSADNFHFEIWLLLALENWIFDFGRPIAASYVPLEWSPLNRMSVGDYFHMAYNVITPFCLLKLLEKSPKKISSTVTYLTVITFVMGASIHLVGDSINHRLGHVGYLHHLSVRDNPIMKTLQPPGLVNCFELLYSFDEEIGHLMWYIPFFFSLFLYFMGSFLPSSKARSSLGVRHWLLLIFSAVYYWYLVTEGQIFSVYILTFVAMVIAVLVNFSQGKKPDINGRFLFYTFSMSLVLIAVWVMFLWDDEVMRNKYPGVIYIPEPWSFYTYYYKDYIF